MYEMFAIILFMYLCIVVRFANDAWLIIPEPAANYSMQHFDYHTQWLTTSMFQLINISVLRLMHDKNGNNTEG